MSVQPNWESLTKNQTDSQTIAQAMAAKIDEHEADPNAHLGANESLQSHRAAEIIDHLAESVVNDKLKVNSRAYVAVVDPSSYSDFSNVCDAVEYAQSVGGGTVYIRRGVYPLTRTLKMLPTVSLQGDGIQDTIIKDDTGQYTVMYIATEFTPTTMYINDLQGFTDDNFLTQQNSAGWDYTPTPGAYLQISGTGITPFDSILVDAGPETIFFDGALEADCTDVEITAYVGCHVTNGSKIVTLLGDQTCESVGILPGMYMGIETGTGGGYVNNILSPTSFELDTVLSNVTGNYGVSFLYKGKHAPRINDITFQGGTTGMRLEWTTGVQQVVIDRCEFLGTMMHVGHVNSNTQLRSCKNASISNSFFDCSNLGTAYAALSIEDSSVQNCVFNAKGNGSRAICSTGRTNVAASEFLAGSYTGHDWVFCNESGLIFDGNYLESCSSTALYFGANYQEARMSTATNNNIVMKNTTALQLGSWFVQFCDNYIYSATNSGVNITSSCQNIRFTNNSYHGSITNSSTKSLVANNLAVT